MIRLECRLQTRDAARTAAAAAFLIFLIRVPAAPADPIAFAEPQDVTNPLIVPNPETVDTLKFFVEDQYAVDDNLFRLPSGPGYLQSFVGNAASRGDHVNVVSAGVDGQESWRTQTFLIDARIDDNRYARNTEFDGVTGNGKLEWDWRAGPLWSGQAGVIYNRFIPNFQDTLFYSKDIFANREYFGKAQLQYGPHWTLTGGVSDSDNTNSNASLRSDDFHTKSGNFGVHYFTLAEDWIGWDYLYTNGHFASPGYLNGLPYDRDFHDNSARFAGKYAFTSKVVLEANAGYLDHNTPGTNFGSFSGNVWHATLQWQPLTKTQVVFSGYRELYAYLDAQSAFFVSRGYSVMPIWTPRDKITLTLLGSHETHDFLGTGDAAFGLFPQTTSRRDVVDTGQAALAYTPRKYLSVKLTYQHQKRQSNLERFTYVDNLVSAGVTVTF